ncbi:MAG: methyltransferase domain-containing protein [Spirochaetales bacterium]|nr:methyltransferase domain-containing protein [Spirochaetales bacterium]
MNNTNVTHKTVGKFYNTSIVSKFWEMIKKKHMHVGYWEADRPYDHDLYEGAVRFTQYMIDMADIGENKSFIDIGCGFGLPGILLAKQKHCSVTGITASEYQKAYATKVVEKEGLGSKVKFLLADANHLPFESETFDGGWFFESIFHIGHENALHEACRVLKKSSRLLIADFIRKGTLKEEDAEFLKKYAEIRSAVSLADYQSLLEKTGFRLIDIRDITANTIEKERSWGVHLEIIEQHKTELLEMGTEKDVDLLKYFFTNLNRIGSKTIGYCVVKAEKK